MSTSVTEYTDQVIRNIETVIVGKRPQIELLMAALLCQGHVLIEDVPGTGKTMLARAAAASMGITFKRLQCTPDLLPNDITGVSVFCASLVLRAALVTARQAAAATAASPQKATSVMRAQAAASPASMPRSKPAGSSRSKTTAVSSTDTALTASDASVTANTARNLPAGCIFILLKAIIRPKKESW